MLGLPNAGGVTGDHLDPAIRPSMKLMELSLDGSGLTASGLRELLRRCGANLITLNLGGSKAIKEADLVRLTDDATFPNLRDLELSGCGLTDAGFNQVLCMFPRLKFLSLGAEQVSGAGLSEGVSLTSLTTLILQCGITDAGLINLLKVFPNLEFVDLHGAKVSGDGLANFHGRCARLKVLKLAFCDLLTNDGLNELLRIFPSLNYLTLNSTQGRKFVGCSHCQELGKPAYWLLIGYTRVNNQSEAGSAS